MPWCSLLNGNTLLNGRQLLEIGHALLEVILQIRWPRNTDGLGNGSGTLGRGNGIHFTVGGTGKIMC
jgi:hypothetical protein